jgi:hypothetical protein
LPILILTVLGYRIYYIFTKREEKRTKDSSNRRKIIIEHLNRLGNIFAEIEILGEISIFRVAVRETSNDDITRKTNEDHVNSLPLNTGLIEKAILASNTGSFQTDAHSRRQQTYLSPTDLNNKMFSFRYTNRTG